jgi:hypothetical protein
MPTWEKAGMKRYLLAIALGLIITQPCGPGSARAASSGAPREQPTAFTCTLTAYSAAVTSCVVVPRRGPFSVKVKTEKITISGQGAIHDANTEIDVVAMSNPCASPHAQSFKVIVNGPMPTMSVSPSGTLYRSPSAGTCVKTNSVYCTQRTSPCVFELVFSPYHLSSDKGKNKHGP